MSLFPANVCSRSSRHCENSCHMINSHSCLMVRHIGHVHTLPSSCADKKTIPRTGLLFPERLRDLGAISVTWGAYHLTENFGNSGWKINGKVTFRKFQPKIEEYVLR